MDVNICIDKLGLNANTYKLDQSNPPHSITEWTGNDTQPTQAELESAWASYTADYDSKQYARDRAEAYPPMADQLDDIFHNGVAGWKKTIQAVKEAHPKP